MPADAGLQRTRVGLHGSIIVDAVGLGQLVLDGLTEHGFEIAGSNH
jgi:hypothetical protein